MPVKMAPISTNLSKQLATASNGSAKSSPKGSSSSSSSSSNRNLHDEASHQPQERQLQQQQQHPSQEFQDVHIGELPNHNPAPLSPINLRSSNAWQHASVLLRKQQLQSTLKSSEERDQEEQQQGGDADKANSARIGTNSCWGSLQSIFMLPKGLADIKAKNAIMFAGEQYPNNKQQQQQSSSSPSTSENIKSTEDQRTSLSGAL
jgi:hypothetical protein